MMSKGKVKWFNIKKGYGYIVGENGEQLFVHHSAIRMPGFRKLSVNDDVEYDLDTNDRGLLAINVTKIAS